MAPARPDDAAMPTMPKATARPGPARLNRTALVTVLAGVMLATGGCQGYLYGQTGSLMSGYTVDHMVPYLMASGDVDMACQTGVAMGAFLMSFEQVSKRPNRAALVTLLAAGMCAEAKAWSAELARLRALHADRPGAAQDARIVEVRAHALAARRYHRAYLRLVAAFGEPGVGKCPKLVGQDQLLYLLGLSAGLLAVMHDKAGGGIVGVPTSIPHAVARASRCISDKTWWGAPMALRAAIWTSIPGAAPKGKDPWKVLAEATADGDRAGARLAGALEVEAAAAAGRDDLVEKVIRQEHASYQKTPPSKRYHLLDRYAWLIDRHASDVIWTRKTGHRTPVGGFGTFPEPPHKVDDSLLKGLGP